MDARTRSRFVLAALLSLVPLMALWWLAVDDLIAVLRPATAWFAGQILPIRDLLPDAQGGWTAQTGLEITAGKWRDAHQEANFGVDRALLRRYLVAVPFFLALAAAPPRAPRLARMLAIGLAGLALLFILSATALIFVLVAVMINHEANPADRLQFVPPPFYVTTPHYGEITFFLAGLAFYVASYVLPLLAPVLLWAALNPVPRRLILSGVPRPIQPVPD